MVLCIDRDSVLINVLPASAPVLWRPTLQFVVDMYDSLVNAAVTAATSVMVSQSSGSNPL